MKKLDKAYLTAEFKAITDKGSKAGFTSEAILKALAVFTEQYVDKLIESRDKAKEELAVRLEKVTQSSVEMQEKVIEKDVKYNEVINELANERSNLEQAYAANADLYETLKKKEEQVVKLTDAVIKLVDRV